MNTGTSSHGHQSSVNNEVPNLAEEVVLVCVPVDSAILIKVSIASLGIK